MPGHAAPDQTVESHWRHFQNALLLLRNSLEELCFLQRTHIALSVGWHGKAFQSVVSISHSSAIRQISYWALKGTRSIALGELKLEPE